MAGTFVWYCCQCGHGPWNRDIHLACSSCGHKLDYYCHVDSGESIGSYFAKKGLSEKTHSTVSRVGENASSAANELKHPRQDISEEDAGPTSKLPKTCCPQDTSTVHAKETSLQPIDLNPIDVDQISVNPINVNPIDVNSVDFDTKPNYAETKKRFLDALLGPAKHFAKLEDLETNIAHCLYPRLENGTGSFQLEEGEGLFDLFPSIASCEEAMRRAVDALVLLDKEEGFSQDKFNILVDDPKREGVAVVKTFFHEDLVELHMSLQDLLLLESQSPMETFEKSEFPDKKYAMIGASQMTEQVIAIEHLLSPISVDWGQVGIQGSEMSSTNRLCKAFSVLFSVLRLGMISYAGSHVCDFDTLVFDSDVKGRPIKIMENTYIHRMSLACLQCFVGGPIWIFGKRNLRGTSGYKVAMDIDTLTDLWGPAWGQPIENYPNQFSEIFTERGVLCRVPESPDQNLLAGEVPCHWEPKSGLAMTKSIANCLSDDESTLIDVSSTMLIGMDEYQPNVIPEAPAESEPRRAQTSLTINAHCRSSWDTLRQRYAGRLRFPGVSEDRYALDTVQLNGNVSKIVGIGASGTWKRTKGTKHKNKIIEWCNALSLEEVLHPILTMMVGLEVSACTGNARRITLGQAILLANKNLRFNSTSKDQEAVQECNHSVEEISSCVLQCWPQGEKIRQIKDSSVREEKVRETLVRAIAKLENTGVDEDGDLRAWYPFTSTPNTASISPESHKTFDEKHGWIPMLRETSFMSSFAVMSSRCLIAPQNATVVNPMYGKCCGSRPAKYRVRTMLETVLFDTNPTIDNPMPDGTRTDRGKNSGIPTKGELYLGVSRKDFTGFLERVRDNQVILEFHVPRIRYILRKDFIMVREYISEEAPAKVRSSVLIVTS